MRHQSVADLMTPVAVSVRPQTTFKEIARLLDEYGITAVPVVDDENRPLGVVSEADLLHRRNGADSAGGLMTSPAVVARPHWSVVRATDTLGRHHIKRLPVVDEDGRIVGVVSRSDLLRLFLRRDRAIQEEILEEVLTRTLGLSPSALTVDVRDGRVTLSGTVSRRSLARVAVRLCTTVDGVVDVTDHLGYESDDTARTPAPQPVPVTAEGAVPEADVA
ncbi:CBS domain-containing protein [Streptomyces sp. NPDC058045]|uniref:CBS domain-containing protein n=1 Tax=Streptomyces sp. NPDC058045 TaxID=3346311 RepID=UPI0036ED5C5E